MKSNGPTRVGELGRSWKATDRGWGLKIRRLLRCPASTHSQVFRRFLAAICDDVVAYLSSLGKGGETCPLDRRYMDEDILAAGIRLNETIPLRRIEPLYYPHRHVEFSMFKNQRWCQQLDKRKACPRSAKTIATNATDNGPTPPRQWCQQRSDGIGTSAPAYARPRMLRTDVACRRPPRAVATPRAFGPSAMSLNYAWLTRLPQAYQRKRMETAGTGEHLGRAHRNEASIGCYFRG